MVAEPEVIVNVQERMGLEKGHTAGSHTLMHLVRKAELNGFETVEVPSDTTLRDIVVVLAEFNEGRTVQTPHAVLETILPSGIGIIRFTMLIP